MSIKHCTKCLKGTWSCTHSLYKTLCSLKKKLQRESLELTLLSQEVKVNHDTALETFDCWCQAAHNYVQELYSSRGSRLCADNRVTISELCCLDKYLFFLPSKFEYINVSLLFVFSLSSQPPVFIKECDKNNHTWPFWRAVKITFLNNQIAVWQ